MSCRSLSANRLGRVKTDDTGIIWHYVYDNNGNRLQQLPGSLTPTEGAIQYTYDQSGRLLQVETHDGSSFQLQAEMVYDGRGNRLQAIAHAAGSTITATYTLDPRSGLPLTVDNGINVTMILYGQVAIGEYAVQTAAWTYYLGDAQLSVRQLVDESGSVTQVQTYGPYGVLLHQAGDGGGLFGYQGGQSTANGLWYFGDGYFDPNTGQFLATNGSPLLPLAAAAMANPAGLLFGPILFINWRRRKGKKGVHPATFLLFGVLLAAGLAGCDEPDPQVEVTPISTAEESGTPTPLPTPIITNPETPDPTDEPDPITPTPIICRTPMPTPSPTPSAIVTILFGGSWGQDYISDPGPNPEKQTPVWYEMVTDKTRDTYWYPGNKNVHADEVNIEQYEDKNLIIIGYSSGADSALLFAERYYRHKEDKTTSGNIKGIALLGTTMTDPAGVLQELKTNQAGQSYHNSIPSPIFDWLQIARFGGINL